MARQDMAAEVQPTLKNLRDAAPGPRPVASTVDHFRIVDSGDDGAATMVLYREGEHIPPEHRGLDTVAAVFDDDDGAWLPQGADTTHIEPAAPSTVDSAPKRGRR